MLLDYWICSFCFALVTMIDLKPKICTVIHVACFCNDALPCSTHFIAKKVFIHMYCPLFYMYITFNQVYTVYPQLQYIVLRHFQVKALEKKKWTSQLSVNQPEPGPQNLVGMGGNGSEPSEPWWMLWSCYPVFTSLMATTRMIWLEFTYDKQRLWLLLSLSPSNHKAGSELWGASPGNAPCKQCKSALSQINNGLSLSGSWNHGWIPNIETISVDQVPWIVCMEHRKVTFCSFKS